MIANLFLPIRNTITVSLIQHKRSNIIPPAGLAKLLNISLDSPHQIIDSTTQKHIRLNTTTAVYWRYNTLYHEPQYRQLGAFLTKFASNIF